MAHPHIQPLRVILACDWFIKYTAGLAAGLADQERTAVGFVTRTHDREFGGLAGSMEKYVQQVTGGKVDRFTINGRASDPKQLRKVVAVRRAIQRWRPDVVHYQDTVGNDPRLIVAARLPSDRVALTIHDPSPHAGESWPLQRRIGLHLLMRRASLIFAHSEALRNEIRAIVGPHVPIVVVAHGMDPPEVRPLPEQPSLLFFGRISTYYKGVDVLLDAMPLVWSRLPETLLTIAGPGEIDDHASLRDPRVIVRNQYVPDDELPALFAATTCCVLPYRQASQSGVGSQAKSFGRPIVASAVGGLPDLVSAESGRLVPPGDPRALADALVEILSDPPLAESMSRAAANWVSEAGWQQVGRRTLEAYVQHLTHRGR